jgi:glucosamine kinase
VLATAPSDPAAAELLAEAGHAIAGLAEALAQAGCARIALLGGLAAPLQPFLPPSAASRLSPALGDALDGALGLAKQRLTALNGTAQNA